VRHPRARDYPYQHPKALELLLSAADFLRHAGQHGMVLLLDEVENVNQQFNIIGRRKSYDTLGRLMARESILPILFVTRRFFEQAEEDMQSGQGDCWRGWTHHSKWFVQSLKVLEVLRPPRLDEPLAEQLVQKLGSLHKEAYSTNIEIAPVAGGVLKTWRATSTRSVRLLVRLALNEFDLLQGAEAPARPALCP
jgi:hypothetical protein